MKILIVSQVTGIHGWSSFQAYISGLNSAEFDYEVCSPKSTWDSNILEDEDNLEAKLSSLSHDDTVLFCGFDWHSQVLHKNATYREWIVKCEAKKVGIFQEHLTASWIVKDENLKSAFNIAVSSAVSCLTHIVCNHEQDVSYVTQLVKGNKPVLFLPFFADLTVFKNLELKREIKGFFRGKRAKLLDSDPYYKRNSIIEFLRTYPDFQIKEFKENSYNNADEMVSLYNRDLNEYEIQLNLPSLSRSLTCRPFEIGAAGGCLISEKSEGVVSQGIFTKEEADMLHPFNGENLLHTVKHLIKNEEVRIRKRSALQSLVISNHSHENRIKQLFDWLSSDSSVIDIYSSLVNPNLKSRILIDLVFFQYAHSGIARVWHAILKSIVSAGLADNFVLLKRKGTVYNFHHTIIEGFHIIEIESHSYDSRELDKEYLNKIYEIYKADGFISTYFTYTNYKNFILLHDFIPEFIDKDCYQDEMWLEKKEAIENCRGFFSISDSTSEDLLLYYPETGKIPLYSAYNQADNYLPPTNSQSIDFLINRYKLAQNVILVVGERVGYNGYKNIANGVAALQKYIEDNSLNKNDFSVLCVGGAERETNYSLESNIEKSLFGIHLVRAKLTDEQLSSAYSLASLLLYPSTVEGFGLPPIEAAHFDTPSLLVDNKINREIWGSEFPMSKSGEIEDLAAALSYILSNNESCATALHSFKINRLPGLIYRGSKQGISLAENLLLNNKRFTAKSVLAHPSQIRSWSQRLLEDSYYRKNSEIRTKNSYKVTAILSVFKAEKYLTHCLKDLTDQTLFKSGDMEIIIIDSASPQNEYEIVKEFVTNEKNIFYYRTPSRETLYLAWSRACKLSRGKYITNTNSDDRHRLDFMECLASYLDANEDVQLVYPQQYITFKENEDFCDHVPSRIWGWPNYTLEQLKIGNHVGSQPMWKRSVHKEIGFFQSSYTCAGDYEFWLRIASNVGPLALYPIPLGTYYFNPVGIEHGDPIKSKLEMDEICEKYDIVKNYEVSSEDNSNSDEGRDFHSLQYNGVELKNEVTVLLRVASSDFLKKCLFEIEKQSLFKNHKLNLLIDVTDGELEVFNFEIGICNNREAYSEGKSIIKGCLLSLEFSEYVDLPEDIFENFISEFYMVEDEKRLLKIPGVKIEGYKNGQ